MCPGCRSNQGQKLSKDLMLKLAYRFFVLGTFHRMDFGGAPIVQFNEHRKTNISAPEWLNADISLFEKTLGIGFFYYGPPLWMVGEVEPLKDLEDQTTRGDLLQRILKEYPIQEIETGRTVYRLRRNPGAPNQPSEYDSPPAGISAQGRFDSNGLPILYASADLEVCVHECRVTAEDELYFATLVPTRRLRVLDLSVVLSEGLGITSFESLDMAVHMLFLAGEHSYEITRDLALAASASGLDGLIYPSYFSQLRLGVSPLRTSFGLSHRQIPQLRAQEESLAIQNLVVFGRPVEAGTLKVVCINKLIMSRVKYDFHFGPPIV